MTHEKVIVPALSGLVGLLVGSLSTYLLRKEKADIAIPVRVRKKVIFEEQEVKDEREYSSDNYTVYLGDRVYLPGEDAGGGELVYYPRTNIYILNGIPIEHDHFNEEFIFTVLPIGLSKKTPITVYFKTGLKLIVRYNEDDGVEEEPYLEEGASIIDSDDYYDPDEEFIEDEEILAAIEEQMEADLDDEIDDLLFEHGPFFTPGGILFVNEPTLSEQQYDEGWDIVSWSFKKSTGLLYDELEEVIGEEDVLEWLGVDILTVLVSPDIYAKYPDRVAYVQNGNLKLLYHIYLE